MIFWIDDEPDGCEVVELRNDDKLKFPTVQDWYAEYIACKDSRPDLIHPFVD